MVAPRKPDEVCCPIFTCVCPSCRRKLQSRDEAPGESPTNFVEAGVPIMLAADFNLWVSIRQFATRPSRRPEIRSLEVQPSACMEHRSSSAGSAAVGYPVELATFVVFVTNGCSSASSRSRSWRSKYMHHDPHRRRRIQQQDLRTTKTEVNKSIRSGDKRHPHRTLLRNTFCYCLPTYERALTVLQETGQGSCRFSNRPAIHVTHPNLIMRDSLFGLPALPHVFVGCHDWYVRNAGCDVRMKATK